MIFKKGDKVRPINKECKSQWYQSWNPEFKKLNELLTREQSKKYTSDNIYHAYLHTYRVIGYISCINVCVEDVGTKDICVFDERELAYAGDRVKEYNIPGYLRSDIDKIIIAGRYVKVILTDGAEGEALCNDNETFIESVGIEIAHLRAKANSVGGKGYYE